MTGNSEATNVSRRQFLAVAGSIAAASSFVFGKDGSPSQSSTSPAAAGHVVIIKVVNNTIQYDVSPPQDPKNLRVNNGDDIKWDVRLPLRPGYRIAILFIGTTPFAGANGHAFQWSETEGAGGGYGVGPARYAGDHEYCVALYDKGTGALYLDDPKIIVGRGNCEDAKEELVKAEGELKKAASSDHNLEGRIGSIKKEVRNLIDDLKCESDH